MASLLAFTALLSGSPRVHATETTRFTFTPTFQDSGPGKRQWEKRGIGYVETLPSGRLNTFRVHKPGAVINLKGTILQKIEEPNFFVFVADLEAKRKELWWWRDKGPWKFMDIMKNVIAPVRID